METVDDKSLSNHFFVFSGIILLIFTVSILLDFLCIQIFQLPMSIWAQACTVGFRCKQALSISLTKALLTCTVCKTSKNLRIRWKNPSSFSFALLLFTDFWTISFPLHCNKMQHSVSLSPVTVLLQRAPFNRMFAAHPMSTACRTGFSYNCNLLA